METSHQYEMTIFVSKKLGFGFILETVKISAGEYQVKITRFDPSKEAKDRVTWLYIMEEYDLVKVETSTVKNITFK